MAPLPVWLGGEGVLGDPSCGQCAHQEGRRHGHVESLLSPPTTEQGPGGSPQEGEDGPQAATEAHSPLILRQESVH